MAAGAGKALPVTRTGLGEIRSEISAPGDNPSSPG
jgi:hypothetical protein